MKEEKKTKKKGFWDFVLRAMLWGGFCVLFTLLFCLIVDPYNVFHARAIRDNGVEANKNYIKLNEDKTEPLTDDLILYALRRDGILMVSDIYGQMTDNVKYVDSGITIKDYDASTTDPRKMVFNTSVDPRYIDSNSNDNFENIEFEIGEEDPETGRANVDFIYTNIIIFYSYTMI